MKKLPGKLAFVDVETTGGDPGNDRIIEIAVIRVENGRVVKTWDSLVDPGCYIPPEITRITGIKADDLVHAPVFRNISDQVEELLADCVFTAHNARFDYGFVKAELNRVGCKFVGKQLCTVRLSRSLFPQYRRHNLDELMVRFNLSSPNRHRALADARVIHDFYHLALTQSGETKFLKALSEILLHPATPANVGQSVLDNLPEAPGVYIFYGESGMPLYIGKSHNIKSRVMSHLTASLQDAGQLRLSREVTDIEYEVTGGDLSALLRESELVKKLQPLHNRQLRSVSSLIFLKPEYINNYKTISLVSGQNPLPGILGVFKTSDQAKDFLHQKSREYNLCEKLLGLEKTRSTCFASHLGKCTACTNEEDPLKYNLRFDMAFSDNKIPDWYYDGPVVIHEGDSSLVFDNWRYLGSIDSESYELLPGIFDLDTYKILRHFLRDPKNQTKISLMK